MRHPRRRARKQTPYSGRATRSPPLARRVPLNELSSRRKTEATFAELGCEDHEEEGNIIVLIFCPVRRDVAFSVPKCKSQPAGSASLYRGYLFL